MTWDCGYHSHPVRIIYAIRTRTTKSPYGLPVLREAYNSSPGLAGIGMIVAGQADILWTSCLEVEGCKTVVCTVKYIDRFDS